MESTNREIISREWRVDTGVAESRDDCRQRLSIELQPMILRNGTLTLVGESDQGIQIVERNSNYFILEIQDVSKGL